MLRAAAAGLQRPAPLPLAGPGPGIDAGGEAGDLTAPPALTASTTMPAPPAPPAPATPDVAAAPDVPEVVVPPKPYDGALEEADDVPPAPAVSAAVAPTKVPVSPATGRSTVEPAPGEALPMGVEAEPVEAEPAPASRKRGRGRLVLLLVIVLFVAGVAAAAAVVQPWRPTVTVPQIVGLTRDEAVARLQPEHLSLKVTRRSASETVQAGRVLAAHPARQRQGKAVGVTLSSGPEERVLPAAAGRPADELTKELTGLGLNVVQNPVDSETVAAGTTLTIDPPAGRRVARGATVTLAVSAGPPAHPVPDVAGKSPDEAIAALKAVGLTGTGVDVFDDKVPSGKVIGTNPAAGTAVRPGAAVTVNVSKGPDLVSVPAVSSKTPPAAQQAVTAAGLVVSATYGPPSGHVFSTQPAAGAKVRRGSAVALYTK